MPDLPIERHDDGSSGAFVIFNPDGGTPRFYAEMTYSWRGRVMVIHHTGVREQLQGHGVARTLVPAAIDAARAEGFRIDPVCPYALRVFSKDTEGLADVTAPA